MKQQSFSEWYFEPFIEAYYWFKEQYNIKYELQPSPVVFPAADAPVLFRPQIFDQYIGQEKAKHLLKAYITGTKARGKSFPHTMIHGHAGCGKTALAHILANELQVPFTECVASELVSPLDLLLKIQNTPSGIIFIDEIHSLDRTTVEGIYTLMEEFRYNDQFISPFTLIGATTELGEIIKDRRPFYDRFKIVVELEKYTVEEMSKIAAQYKDKNFQNDILTSSGCQTIAENCRCTPRCAIRLLESAIYLGDVAMALSANNIIKEGYTNKDLMILEYINLNVKGVGLQGLCSYLGTSAENYQQDIEPYLLQNHLILRTARGRKITDAGKAKIADLKQ